MKPTEHIKNSEFKIGDIIQINQTKSEEITRTINNKYTCTGDYGAVIYDIGIGFIIKNNDFDKTFGDENIYYDIFLPSKNTIIHFGEKLVIKDIAGGIREIQSLNCPNSCHFFLSEKELNQIPFRYVGEVDNIEELKSGKILS